MTRGKDPILGVKRLDLCDINLKSASFFSHTVQNGLF